MVLDLDYEKESAKVQEKVLGWDFLKECAKAHERVP